MKCPTCGGSGNTPDPDTLGERLTMLRGKATMRAVSQASGVPLSNVSRLEAGITKNPYIEHVVALAKHFGVTTDYLLMGERAT